MRNAPGIRMIHQLPVISAFSDRDSMLPQEMISSGSPMPRKLRVDSLTMALRTFMTTMNMMEARKLGARCRRRMWKNPPPMHRDATTYSLVRSCRTSVRTTLAMLAQLVTPMTTDRLSTDACPQIA